MSRSTPGLFRQGDVFLIPPTHPAYRKPVGQLRPVAPVKDRYVLAEGEVTGHSHSVPAASATLSLDEGNVTYLTIRELTEVRHQEHDPIALAPTVEPYEVLIQREWSDALEPRQVAD